MSLTWKGIQDVYEPDVAHQVRAAALGLECPEGVFEQLFHDHHDDADMARLLPFVDWAEVRREEALSRALPCGTRVFRAPRAGF
jgi:hypothetical protein